MLIENLACLKPNVQGLLVLGRRRLVNVVIVGKGHKVEGSIVVRGFRVRNPPHKLESFYFAAQDHAEEA